MLKEEYQFLNKLSEINNNTGIKFLHRAVNPGCHCPMHYALGTIDHMKGVSSLVVGMAECGYYSRFVARSPYGKHGELHYVYELDKNEVVFGCRKGVMNALLQMSKEGATTIVVILTCVPALIGEDMESIIEELKSETNTTIAFIDGAHFKRNGYQSGFTNTFEQLLGAIEKREVNDGKTVNIFGASRGMEFNLLRDSIIRSGYHINEYLHQFAMEDLYDALNGIFTIVLNPKMLKGAKLLYKKYGIPYISMTNYTPTDIYKGYEEIAKILKLSKEDFASLISKQGELEQKIVDMKIYSKDVTYIATPPELQTLAISDLLCEVDMKAELLHVEEFDEGSVYHKEQILQKGQDPYLTYITNEDKVMDAFQSELPRLSLGKLIGMDEKYVIPNKELLATASLCGFERSIELLNVINKRLVDGEDK